LIEAYRRQLEHTDTIISLHPSLDVSGTVRSALTAKNSTLPDADIRIIDTRTAGGNLASLVIAATEWAEQDIEADEIVQRIGAMIPRGRVYFLVATLEYLQKGGRIGGASALIGTALQIKPILELKDGRVDAFEKVRTHHRALERIKELVLEQCPRSTDAHLCVMQADAQEVAEKLVADLKGELGIPNIPIYPCGASITTHVGPGTLAVAFFG
jgi:DegV family protein with EDD domain